MSRPRRMQGKRAFTLLEMMIVMVVATILTTLGLVGVANVIKEARYRSDRARLYMDVREARDRAKRGQRFLFVRTLATQPFGQRTLVRYELGPTCSGPFPTATWTLDYPSVDHAGDDIMCFHASGPTPGASSMNFQPIRPLGLPPMDVLSRLPDGSLVDTWNEFPDEGCLESNPSGDPDGAMPCGD